MQLDVTATDIGTSRPLVLLNTVDAAELAPTRSTAFGSNTPTGRRQASSSGPTNWSLRA